MRYILLLSISVRLCSVVGIVDALNIAQGKPAYQPDSLYYDYLATADHAVDGNVNQHYHNGRSCAHTMATGNVTWEVDLQGIYVINSVKLYNRLDCCMTRLSDVEILIGVLREGFHARAGFHPGPVGATYTCVLDTPMYGRWLKVVNHSPGNPLVLCEVQVEGDLWNPSKVKGPHKYAVFVNHIHTGTAIDIARNISKDIMCASQCSQTQNCVSAHYNKATLTCSLFDTLNFTIGGGAYDVILVISYYAGAIV